MMPRSPRNDTRLTTLWLATCLLFLANVALKYPGGLSSDSGQQLAEAISGHYTDWHPPIMAWVWALMAPQSTGSRSMFLLHMAAHWGGFALIADALHRAGRRNAAWVVMLCGAFPVFIVYSGWIIKDVGMASTLVLAFALGFRARIMNRPQPAWSWALMLLLLAYGTLVRANAIFAFGPLAVYLLAGRFRRLRSWRLFAASLTLSVLALPVSSFVNHRLIGAEDSGAIQSLILLDLSGIATHVGAEGVLPPELMAPPDVLERCYTPYYWDTYAPWGTCSDMWRRLGDRDSAARAELKQRWLAAIAEHPLAYAEHRLKVFNSILSFVVPAKHCRYVPGCGERDPVTNTVLPSTDHDIRLDYARRNVFIWPVTWLVVGLALFAITSGRTDDEQVIAIRVLSLSGVLNLGALALVGVATDVRFAYWTIMAVLIALVLAIDSARRGTLIGAGRGFRGLAAALLLVWSVGLWARITDFTAFLH